MAIDKLVDSAQLDADLGSVADAIRAKSGGTGSLAFPAGFVTEIGNISGGGGKLKMGVIRPDAELVQSYSYDKYIVEDEGITIPSYTTTDTVLKAGSSLLSSYALDSDNYDYTVLQRALAIPVYSSSTKGKGREVYWLYSLVNEICEFPSGTFTDGGKSNTSRSVGGLGTARSFLFYWSSSSAVSVATTNYGAYVSTNYPSTGSSGSTATISLTSPSLRIRGSSTYFTSTYWGYLTDIRYQYKIEIYRFPKSNGFYGLNVKSQAAHILDCISEGGTLT